jgi:hypothetical protein
MLDQCLVTSLSYGIQVWSCFEDQPVVCSGYSPWRALYMYSLLIYWWRRIVIGTCSCTCMQCTCMVFVPMPSAIQSCTLHWGMISMRPLFFYSMRFNMILQNWISSIRATSCVLAAAKSSIIWHRYCRANDVTTHEAFQFPHATLILALILQLYSKYKKDNKTGDCLMI